MLTVSRKPLLVDGSDREFRRTVHDSLGFAIRLQEIRDGLGEAIGLSGPAYSILIAIEHLSEDGEVGVSRVADHLHLSGAFVTIEVGKLVRRGLVEKRILPEDRRRVGLRVTPEAGRLLDGLGELQRPVNDAIFVDFDAADFRKYSIMIAALLKGAEEALAILDFHAGQRRRAG